MPVEDLRLAQGTRVNLLLTGFDRTSEDAALHAILSFSEAALAWHPGERLLLPTADRTATLVLHDLGGLRRDEQRLLFDWIQSPRRARVICTSATPLLPLVEVGAFLPELYYRLNTVYLEPLY